MLNELERAIGDLLCLMFLDNCKIPIFDFLKEYYRVFIKEGHKVNAYYTAKIYFFGTFKGFILTTTYEHLFIYTKDLKYITLNVIGQQLYFLGKIADFSHFKPT